MAGSFAPLRPLPPAPENISLYFFLRMCFDGFPEVGDEWYDFGALDNVPHCCCKYEIDPGLPLEFCNPPATDHFEIIELPLWPALRTMHAGDRFCLNPARWDRVKRQMSKGSCERPWMAVDQQTNIPRLMDGRHRIVAFLRLLGMTSAPFLVEPCNVDVVSKALIS